MATIEESECDPKSLACMFQEGLDLYNHLDTLTEPTNSLDFQVLTSLLIHFVDFNYLYVSLFVDVC